MDNHFPLVSLLFVLFMVTALVAFCLQRCGKWTAFRAAAVQLAASGCLGAIAILNLSDSFGPAMGASITIGVAMAPLYAWKSWCYMRSRVQPSTHASASRGWGDQKLVPDRPSLPARIALFVALFALVMLMQQVPRNPPVAQYLYAALAACWFVGSAILVIGIGFYSGRRI